MSTKQNRSLRTWEVIRRRQIADVSPWLQLCQEEIRLPDGKLIKDFYYIDQPDYVVVFGINTKLEALCLWHYKHGPRRVCLGLPAGYIENNETPLEAAKRELWEETGCRAEYWQELGIFTVDGNRGCGQAHIFFARNVCAYVEPEPDDLEEFLIEWIEFESLRKYLFSGKVANMSDGIAMSLSLNLIIKGR